MRYYAGIGSRETPVDILLLMTEISVWMGELGFCLRSGGAAGADHAFELMPVMLNFPTEIFKAAKNIRNTAIKEIGMGSPECTLVETWVTGSGKQELELGFTSLGMSKG